MKKKLNRDKRVLCLCLVLLLLLSLAACNSQTDEQDSTPPTASVQPTIAPTLTPEPTPPIPFTDVPENSFYYDAVVWAYENGITSSDSLFEPLSTCSRAQAITFIWRAMGSPEPQITENPISDISPSDWYYKPALWAYETGVAAGDTFKPNGSCTNSEALTFLWRAEGKPMAAVSNSTVALAASGAYYERPAAWADSNGLFAQMGTAFDPAAPCSRAYLMNYLYWAEEQWTGAEETRALQTEYEQIIQDSQLYEVHGTGLFYADYVDVEGDGTVELLTVGIDKDLFITAAVYANDNSHVEKYCEGIFKTAYLGKFGGFSVGTTNGELYVCSAGGTVEGAGAYYDSTYQFFKVEKGTFSLEDDLHDKEEYSFEKEMFEYAYFVSDKVVTEHEYNQILKKYPEENSKSICSIDFGDLNVPDRGLLPTPQIQVNGTAVKLSANPYISKGVSEYMVPLRDVLEAMGVAVYANSDASVILASTKSDTLVITYKSLEGHFEGINSDWYYDKTYKYSMNGGEFQKIAIEFTNGKAFLPLQTIVSLFGATAEWDGKVGATQITSNILDSNRMSQDELKQLANFDLNQALKIAANQGYKESQGYGNNTGYKATSFRANDGSAYGLSFKNGKAIWMGYVEVSYTLEKDTDGNIVGLTIEEYPIEVANDGTVTTYPNDIRYRPSSQF